MMSNSTNATTPGGYDDLVGVNSPRATYIQIIFSTVLGSSAFLAFSILRPKWPSLYAARKQKRNQAAPLPDLPDNLFAWIPALWRISEQQVLASAGLDAYVFLRFFKMALKCLFVTLFFALVVIKPVHDAFPDTPSNSTSLAARSPTNHAYELPLRSPSSPHILSRSVVDDVSTDYLWMYLVFAYLFTGLAIYLMITETESIIDIRQEYLGNQSTITDRTIRLSGIPPPLRSEEKIKDFVEGLEIGKVDKVTLCKNWRELDDTLSRRASLLYKLENAWTVHIGKEMKEDGNNAIHTARAEHIESANERHSDEESGPLLGQGASNANGMSKNRPKATIRYGFLNLKSRYVDAIDLYEEKLRQADQKIAGLRKGSFETTPVAFVTMDSVAASQMAVQAVLDPSPMQLIAKPAAAPDDIVWPNTYLPRARRMIRSWSITVLITFLTIFWAAILVPIAGAINPSTIKKVFPSFGGMLESNPNINSLVTTQAPTLLSALLFVGVPYLYDWLASKQGMMSHSDEELSAVSKNFFFAFFNYFIVFTAFGTFSNFYEVFEHFRDSLNDPQMVANQLAKSLQGMLPFYTNFIMLQGVGLFPFRLLEFGSVVLYPIYRFLARTPRDYAELDQPPAFNYAFHLPQNLLIFTISLVYSVFRSSWKVLLAGFIYFALGRFVYKYQLLYAMDHRQQSTGKAWTMICRRMMMGLILFQGATTGQLLLKLAFKRAFAVVFPLMVGTVWFFWGFGNSYDPLVKFIALKSIVRKRRVSDGGAGVGTMERDALDPDGWGEEDAGSRYEAASHSPVGAERGSGEDSDGKGFVNPSLVAPLEEVWLADRSEREGERGVGGAGEDEHRRRLTSAVNAMV